MYWHHLCARSNHSSHCGSNPRSTQRDRTPSGMYARPPRGRRACVGDKGQGLGLWTAALGAGCSALSSDRDTGIRDELVCVPRLSVSGGEPLGVGSPSASRIALLVHPCWCCCCCRACVRACNASAGVPRSASSEKRHRGNVNLRRDRSGSPCETSPLSSLLTPSFGCLRSTSASCQCHRTRVQTPWQMRRRISIIHTPYDSRGGSRPMRCRRSRHLPLVRSGGGGSLHGRKKGGFGPPHVRREGVWAAAMAFLIRRVYVCGRCI
ncbi:hypothetical protein GY45DRAFT_774855 [Cubamyces sp. BRFM 1775]|nr:hypothetical protein GY45DRAFT_774855 [Cubamyces sp. BRFM 1775]